MGSSSSSSCPSSSSKYGDISKVKTTGASSVTARADNQPSSGVAASEAMAKHDSGQMEDYKKIINIVAGETYIHPALIAAIISRESRAGEGIKHSRPEPGYGDGGNGFGLMQFDEKRSGEKKEGKWNSVEHLRQATKKLVEKIVEIQEKFPQWKKEQQLKGGIAAYNMGTSAVESKDPDNVDENTTNKDYANDVVARAQWFIKNGYDD